MNEYATSCEGEGNPIKEFIEYTKTRNPFIASALIGRTIQEQLELCLQIDSYMP